MKRTIKRLASVPVRALITFGVVFVIVLVTVDLYLSPEDYDAE
jgi:hypothetical protein